VNGLVAAFLALFFLAVAPASGKELPVPRGVVEFFTSQGCGSCPAADRILAELADRGEFVVLGYHVDYWDYLGWKDTLASPAFSERQQLYSRSLGTRGVYTPQAVVNGRVHVNGGDRPALDRALAGSIGGADGWKVALTLREENDSVIISAPEGDAEGKDVHLILVFFDKKTEVHIENGENGGRTITYANVVTGLQTAGMWHGEAVQFELPRSALTRQGSGGCAAFLQVVSEGGLPGPILGATVMRYP
jgi:hypothetical protein